MGGALKELIAYIEKDDEVENFETVKRIRSKNPELKDLSPGLINNLWAEFSTHFYCATYLMCSDNVLERFRQEVVLPERYLPVYYCEHFYLKDRSCDD